MKQRIALALVIALLVAAACTRPTQQRPVIIVTTPDLAGAGITSMLAEQFTMETKARAEVIVTEEPLVTGLVKRGIAQVVITASPRLYDQLQKSGAVKLSQTIAYDDYLVVGPKNDPARARSAKSAAEALRRIARRDRAFCSPLDVPELRYRESLIWEESPAEPEDNRRYRECRGSAADVLQEASKRQAYTLTDRATFVALQSKVKLVPLIEGTPLLHNDVMVVQVQSQPRSNADWFVHWVMSYRGRDAVEHYRFDGDRHYFFSER